MHNPSIKPADVVISVFNVRKAYFWTNNEQLEYKVTKGFKPSFLMGSWIIFYYQKHDIHIQMADGVKKQQQQQQWGKIEITWFAENIGE